MKMRILRLRPRELLRGLQTLDAKVSAARRVLIQLSDAPAILCGWRTSTTESVNACDAPRFHPAEAHA
jgi:hypothetical protein